MLLSLYVESHLFKFFFLLLLLYILNNISSLNAIYSENDVCLYLCSQMFSELISMDNPAFIVNKNPVKLQHLCRMCATPCNKSVPIFGPVGEENELASKFNNYLPLKVLIFLVKWPKYVLFQLYLYSVSMCF